MPESSIARLETRGPDGGPTYVETPENLAEFTGIAEPYNAVTAALFVVVGLVFLIRLRGRFRRFPMLSLTLPLLLTGGIGGTLYHGTRSERAFFLLDVVPIYLLGMLVTIGLWIRLGPKLKHVVIVLVTLCVIQMLGHRQLPKQWAINVSYASLALLILMPIVATLLRTRFADAGWVGTALVSFGFAWFFRLADSAFDPPLLPMGTHWLWHVFGAITTAALGEYLFRYERRVA